MMVRNFRFLLAMARKALLVAPALLLVPVALAAGDSLPPALPIWDFELGITNARGGRYNVFQREPSWARTYLDPDASRLSSGHALRVTVHREAEGFCGIWMDLATGDAVPRQYLDASSYRYLSFWVRGEKGGEDFEFELADDRRREDDDARGRQSLSAHLSGGAATEWQQVQVPLADFPGLKLERLLRLTFHFARPGDYRFYLDEIALKRDKSAIVPLSPSAGAEPALAAGRDHRALWVWNTKPLFDSSRPQEADRFFLFCAENGIREIYLAMEFDRREANGAARYELEDPNGYRAFLGRAHKLGLRVEGLAGTPEWAARERHAHALAAVEAALAFNRASPEGARFDGVHFDVEPYVLIGYSDPEYRGQILLEFLEMVALCAARVRAEANLDFSCDVPAWFYPAGSPERDRLTVPFQGAEKTVGEHLSDLLDQVTIMDYVNQADGAGGIIARGTSALEYAAAQGRRIVVGLETFLERDRTVHFVCGLPAEKFRKRLAAAGLRNRLYFEGFRMAVFSDEITVHIGLGEPREMTAERRAAFEGALLRLARLFSVATEAAQPPVNTAVEEARAAIAENPEWRGFETFELLDSERRQIVSGFRSVRRMLPRITFHGLGRQVFEEETRSTVEWLGRYPSFAGLAIHFYDSFRELLEGK